MKQFLKDAKGHLMSGIGYILPLIIGASLIIAIPRIIALCFGITSLDAYADTTDVWHYFHLFEQVGWLGISLMNTVLAGFIAYSIADKPAIGAGFIGGYFASQHNAGFIGAVIAAFVAGYAVKFCKKHIHVPESFQSMMPLVVLPLIGTGVVAVVMGLILGDPLAWINTSLVEWLKAMSTNGTSSLVMALILGAMIASDMGGPINKSAWMAGNALLAEKIFLPNVYINCAICIPPLAYAIATVIRKKRFSNEFRETGKGNWVMGFLGITEGAIPFTLCKPQILIPVNIIGGALGTAVCCILGGTAMSNISAPPVGGIYGFVTVPNGWAYLIGLLVGALFIAVVSTLLVDFSKDANELGGEDVDIDEIDISFEDIK